MSKSINLPGLEDITAFLEVAEFSKNLANACFGTPTFGLLVTFVWTQSSKTFIIIYSLCWHWSFLIGSKWPLELKQQLRMIKFEH